jgi:hypothetical protein
VQHEDHNDESAVRVCPIPEAGLRVVGWVQPTGVSRCHSVGYTHPTEWPRDPSGTDSELPDALPRPNPSCWQLATANSSAARGTRRPSGGSGSSRPGTPRPAAPGGRDGPRRRRIGPSPDLGPKSPSGMEAKTAFGEGEAGAERPGLPEGTQGPGCGQRYRGRERAARRHAVPDRLIRPSCDRPCGPDSSRQR